MIVFFQGDDGLVVDLLGKSREAARLVLPPVVPAEVLNAPWLRSDFANLIRLMPVLEIRWGYRERAASTRARILSRRLRARLADSSISQSCLDHETPLITRDRDFRHFAEHTGQFG